MIPDKKNIIVGQAQFFARITQKKITHIIMLTSLASLLICVGVFFGLFINAFNTLIIVTTVVIELIGFGLLIFLLVKHKGMVAARPGKHINNRAIKN